MPTKKTYKIIAIDYGILIVKIFVRSETLEMCQKYIFLFALGSLFVVGSVDANDLQCFVDGECTNSLHIDSALVEDEVKCEVKLG